MTSCLFLPGGFSQFRHVVLRGFDYLKVIEVIEQKGIADRSNRMVQHLPFLRRIPVLVHDAVKLRLQLDTGFLQERKVEGWWRLVPGSRSAQANRDADDFPDFRAGWCGRTHRQDF